MVTTIDLKGKLVLLTGGGRGLGVDIAKAIAEAGADLAITYNATPADQLAEEIAKTYGVKCKAYKMPAEDSKAIDETVQLVTKELGELDVIIANAGICLHVDAVDTTDKQFEDTFKVNTFSPFYLSRAAYKTWYPTPDSPAKKDKIILFVSSMSGQVYNYPQNQVAYNASKAALTMLGKSLAGEWASKGIRVNILSPGYISTDMSTGSKGGSGWLDEWRRRTPMDRFAKPKEIADMLVVMASDKTTFMTGSDVILDGGYTIY
ncbi:NAD(P)-binding protein [Meredithblackwellia eburnea MCA 4105]